MQIVSGVAALGVGGTSVGGVAWYLLRSLIGDLKRQVAEMARDIDTLRTERVEKVEDELDSMRRNCCGAANKAAIVRLETRTDGMDAQARSVDTKLERLTTALENQSTTFRDMSLKMERYIESTTRQDERINATAARVGGLHEQFRKHTDDRGIHGHG